MLANALESDPDACQHEAMNYGNLLMRMSTMNFKMLPIMMWGMVVVGSCLQRQHAEPMLMYRIKDALRDGCFWDAEANPSALRAAPL